MPQLTWIAPNGRTHVYGVFKRITTIGRAATSDVVLDAPGVARHHAQLVFDGRDFHLQEADADAPIEVNGKRRRRTKIFHQDRIAVGDVELRFSIFEESTPADEDDASRRIARQLEGMRRLAELSERLSGARTIREQLEALIDAVIEVTGAQKGFVILFRDGVPHISVARNVQQQNLLADLSQLSDSILRHVVETQRPLIVSDALHDTMFRSSESVMNLKLCSVMCAPLIARGQLLGVIYVGNDDVRSLFEQTSLEVMTVFAAQGALVLQNALLLDELRSDRDALADRLESRKFGEIVGTSPALVEVFKRIERVAPTDVNVLVTGETGTGKELIAREIHARSARARGPFVVVNCGAIPETLMESELFGHVRGAFTGAVATRQGRFQAASGGTLFLDEIGEMPIALQVKLLRALQERVVTKVGETRPEPVDIRVIAATHRNLEEEIRQGRFREDLYYRLNVVNIHLPPLRERGEDVIVLAKYLLARYAAEYGGRVKGFTPHALQAIRQYDWPGNVRQLENRIKRAVVLCERTLVGPEDLELGPASARTVVPLAQAREEWQRRYVLEVLERNGGNRTKTAHDLGVDPRTIFRYLEREPDPPEPTME
ncbi:MAG: sigma 54-interacting transcriptional regulator [Myxococcota bacterium]|nr:sigma 54-interacting transcriptional regulator [Myxococcota bacterium]MDW8363644.1 sigma 54-interacting transcriptional regulator [Myxococcales bacterium]